MQLRSFFLVAVASPLAIAIACGGGQTEPKGPMPGSTPSESAASVTPSAVAAETSAAPSASAVASAEAPAPAKSWDAMTHDEKLALMKTVVMPKMKEAFQAFDAKKYADFSCKTCHGKPENKGKMPNNDVPKLDPKDQFAKHQKKTPELTKFMMTTVVPQMAKILGEQPYDPKTHQGFGCGNCHFFEK